MANSFVVIHVHYTFSTKNREKLLTEGIRARLWPYMTAIANECGFKALAAGGVEDHAHILLSLPSTMSPARAIQLIKTGSSRWIRSTFPKMKNFHWQEGYGAFSISKSRFNHTVYYINHQEEHHHVRTFKEEYLEFLKIHGIDPEDPYIFG